MKKPIVSIITPCFNSENFLNQMMSSVILQTFKCWELIIVDDKSTDNSVKIIEKYMLKDKRIKLIKSKTNSGPAVARNKAISLASGRYFAFLDADDFWNVNFLKKSMKYIRNKKFIYSSYNRVNKEGAYIDTSSIINFTKYNDLLKGSPISCLTAFIDTKKLGKKFFPLDKNREDLCYWLLLLNKCKIAHGFNFCEANYRIHRQSSSFNKFKMALFTLQDYLSLNNLSFFKAVLFFLSYSLNGISNSIKIRLAKIK